MMSLSGIEALMRAAVERAGVQAFAHDERIVLLCPDVDAVRVRVAPSSWRPSEVPVDAWVGVEFDSFLFGNGAERNAYLVDGLARTLREKLGLY